MRPNGRLNVHTRTFSLGVGGAASVSWRAQDGARSVERGLLVSIARVFSWRRPGALTANDAVNCSAALCLTIARRRVLSHTTGAAMKFSVRSGDGTTAAAVVWWYAMIAREQARLPIPRKETPRCKRCADRNLGKLYILPQSALPSTKRTSARRVSYGRCAFGRRATWTTVTKSRSSQTMNTVNSLTASQHNLRKEGRTLHYRREQLLRWAGCSSNSLYVLGRSSRYMLGGSYM
jgi:hypothetical protein